MLRTFSKIFTEDEEGKSIKHTHICEEWFLSLEAKVYHFVLLVFGARTFRYVCKVGAHSNLLLIQMYSLSFSPNFDYQQTTGNERFLFVIEILFFFIHIATQCVIHTVCIRLAAFKVNCSNEMVYFRSAFLRLFIFEVF